MQLLLLPDNVPHDSLCEEAQKIWKKYFGQARTSCLTRLDKGVKRPNEEKQSLAVTALQKKRRRETAASTEMVDINRVEAVATNGSSGVWSENMAKEVMFQRNKQYDSKVERYLQNALLEDEVDPELVDVALKLRATQEKNDQQRVAKEKRNQNLLLPKKCSIQRNKFHLEDTTWLRKVTAASRHNVMIHPWDAQNWVVSDPSNPKEQVLWSATLLGGLVVDVPYFESDGERGLAIHFSPFVDISRKAYVSEAFKQAHPRVAEVLRHCLAHPRSKMNVLDSWEAFADQHCRLDHKTKMRAIALASDGEATRAKEKNIFPKRDFIAFACRMAFAKRDLCQM